MKKKKEKNVNEVKRIYDMFSVYSPTIQKWIAENKRVS